ncbi:MAG: hypothetical protein EXR72_12290 [Myxococcales bacterium]|nr:hypothetical protein [Myxococcales bacterium]
MRLSVLLLALAAALPAAAEPSGRPTTLLEDDIQGNKRTKIDGAAGDLDAELEQALGGGAGFSTGELEKIEDRLRAALRSERPRATAKLVVFIYPGRVNVQKLRALAEVFVDVELVIDPCERSVCREAVGRHIELVGRSVLKAVHARANYKLVFKSLTLKTVTAMHDQELAVVRLPMAEAVTASAQAGGGMAWLDAQRRNEQEYEPLAIQAIAKQAASRRVVLAAPPQVTRDKGQKTVDTVLRVKGDRNRFQQQVLDALAAAQAGLRENPTTPPEVQLEVAIDIPMKKVETRRFRSPGQPVGLVLDGRLDSAALWANYVEEVKQGKEAGQQLSFSDAEASGRSGPATPGTVDAPDPDDNEVVALLAANFGSLGACVRTEAARDPKFRGVTLSFQWLPTGRSEGAAPKEAALQNTPMARCLTTALSAIRLPRFSGSPRTIEYPIRVK